MARVLVADCTARTRTAIRDALQRRSHTVRLASSAIEALAVVASEPIDWVILDFQIEGMSAISCLRLLRSAPGARRARVVVVACTATKEDVVEAIRAGASDFILRSPEIAATILARLEGGRSSGESSETRGAEADAAGAACGDPRAAESGVGDSGIVGCDEGSADQAPEWKQAIESLRHTRPVAGRTAMLERFDSAAELRALSPVVQRVLSLTANPSASIDQVARVVKQDHAVSIRLLKLANSSVYARGTPVDTVTKAISRIGMSQIRETVLGMAVIDQFSSLSGCERVRGEWFWEHSIVCGIIASRLAREHGIQGEMADALFTAGLLHDIGRVLMAEQLGPEYGSVIETADRLGLPLEVVEARSLSITHADLTDRVLRIWKLPSELINPIALHHLSIAGARRLAPRMIDSIAIVGLANRVAHALLLGSSGNDVVSPIREHVQALKLRRAVLAEIVASVSDEAADMRLALQSRAQSPAAPPFIETVRSRIDRPFRGVCVAIDGEADAMAIAMNALSAHHDAMDGEPNVAVVCVHSPREVPELSRMLVRADPSPERRLPALIVSPNATAMLEPSAMEGRVCRLLPSPTPLARLVDGLRAVLTTTGQSASPSNLARSA